MTSHSKLAGGGATNANRESIFFTQSHEVRGENRLNNLNKINVII